MSVELIAAARAYKVAQAAWEAGGTPRPTRLPARRGAAVRDDEGGGGGWTDEPLWNALRGAEIALLQAALELES